MAKHALFLLLIFLASPIYAQKGQRVLNYLENHFNGGYGAHVMTILPGPHVKAQFYPINLDRFKVYGEVRGELVMASIVGYNYNIQGAVRVFPNLGFHSGIGRWNYVSLMKSKEPNVEPQPLDIAKVNSFEFGIVWLGSETAAFDFYVSVPASIKKTPILIVGGSATLGYVWWNRRDKVRGNIKQML